MKMLKITGLILVTLILFVSCGGAGADEPADYEPAESVVDGVNGGEAVDETIDQTPADVPLYADEIGGLSGFIPGEITFVHRPGMADGVHYWGITETAEHGFTAEITPEQEAWIHRTEEILYMALREFGMRPAGNRVPRFEYTPEGMTVGDVFNRLGAGRFPAWLSVGIELFWVGEVVALEVDAAAWQREKRGSGLPGFGDAWFIPGFVEGSDLSASPPGLEVLVIAYDFVRYVYEAGALDDLVSMYRGNAIRSAEDLRASLWASFADDDVVDICAGLRYERGRMRDDIVQAYIMTVSVPGVYARYYFGIEVGSAPQQFVWDMVRHHVAIGEESIAFIKDWLGLQSARHFSVFNIHRDEFWGGWYGTGIMTNFQHILDPPWAMAHEAVHGILAAANIRNNFPRPADNWVPHFEEGLCILIEHLFEIETQNERFALEATAFQLGYRRGPGNHGNPSRRMTLHDVITRVNSHARWEMTHAYEPGNIGQFGYRYTILNGNHTAASFMFYLYTERGTQADLLRFYRNIYLAEEIYGADMNGLIASWRRWFDAWS